MATTRRPNFVYILADDLGYADLGCTGAHDSYNRPVDVSPNLDRLAAQGLRYTRGYANSAVCSLCREVPRVASGAQVGETGAQLC